MSLNKKEAEQALESFIQNRFPGSQPLPGKAFSRLLFQHVESPFSIETHRGDRAVRVYGKFEYHINRHNILRFDTYHRRFKIKPDALYNTDHSNGVIVGEAKSSRDSTCFSPGSTFSCAHKIADNIVNEKCRNLDSDRRGFIKAFLAQSLGYIDAVSQNNDIAALTCIMQLCPNSKINTPFAQELYTLLPSQIDYVFNQTPKLLTLGKRHVEDEDGVFYLIYSVNCTVVPLIINRMAEMFTDRYF